jgi:hypothetical protein
VFGFEKCLQFLKCLDFENCLILKNIQIIFIFLKCSSFEIYSNFLKMENETEKIREKKKEYGEKIEYVLDGP